MTRLYGLDAQRDELVSAIGSGRMHHGWLLAGPQGVGKGTLARQAAARILANASGRPVGASGLHVPQDHPTQKLLDAGSHPDFRLLERLTAEKTGALARSVTVDQVRALKASFALGTSMGDARVVIVDAIDDLERGGANALLKSLEEPPQGTIFLLISHAPGRLLPTIRSRCRVLNFAPLSDDVMTAALRDEFPDKDDAAIAALVQAGRGSFATAAAYAALDLGEIEAALTALANDGDPRNAVRSALAKSLALKAASPRYQAFLDRAPGFIADHARRKAGAPLERALDAWSKATHLGRSPSPPRSRPKMWCLKCAAMWRRLPNRPACA